jgi:drug/metabolite transporter (DMT)-like permease
MRESTIPAVSEAPAAAAPPQTIPRPDAVTIIVFALAVVLGGSNAVGVRFMVAELPPLWSAALRFGAAGLIFWLLVAARRVPLPRGRALVGALLFGALNIAIGYAFAYTGLRTVPAGLTQVTLASTPLLVQMLAALHRLEPLRLRGVVGVLIAIAGIALAFLRQPGDGVPLSGLLWLMAAAVVWAESLVLLKYFPSSDPLVTNAVGMTAGVLLLLALSWLGGEAWRLPATATTWWAFGYLTLVGSVAYFYAVVFVVRRWLASATAYGFVLAPFVTVVVAWLVAGEAVTPALVGGAAIALFGVWLGALARDGGR